MTNPAQAGRNDKDPKARTKKTSVAYWGIYLSMGFW